jgi:hypothetical protein
MSPKTIRYTAVAVAIAAAAVVSLATEKRPPTNRIDPSVPPAWEVLHPNDGRSQGNVPDLTY